jgi:phosphonate transport system substrate-binding protein
MRMQDEITQFEGEANRGDCRIIARCFLIIFQLAWMMVGCSQRREASSPRYGTTPRAGGMPTYSFAVHPLHNPAKLTQAYQPLIDFLNSRLQDARLDLEASRDYARFEAKYRARKPAFLLPNPWQSIQAMQAGYHVLAMAGDPQDFKGIIIVRKESGLAHASDLKGKSVSYPSPTALAACIMPQYFLHRSGINVNADIENRYVGSQESSIMNVCLGKTEAGATWPPPWRAFQKDHPREAAELKVLWETESLINNSVMMRDDIPAQVGEQVRRLLLELSATTKGKSILAGMETARFLPASDADYNVVRQYISRFEREVRPVEQP